MFCFCSIVVAENTPRAGDIAWFWQMMQLAFCFVFFDLHLCVLELSVGEHVNYKAVLIRDCCLDIERQFSEVIVVLHISVRRSSNPAQ